MAKLSTNKTITHTLELNDEEARGLFAVLNWGIHSAVATKYHLFDIASALSKEFSEDIRDPRFLSKVAV